jgi:hypothetical protein
VDVPLIQSAVGASVKVSADPTQTSKVTYEGTDPLVFGFKAYQLYYDKGKYTRLKPLKSDAGLKGVGGSSDKGTTPFVVESPFVRLRGV